MKRIAIVAIIVAISISAMGQKLIDVYKSGVVRLTPDNEYAKDNDWDKVFVTYNDTLYGRHMGNRKSLRLLPNGSVVVNHAYKNYFSMFSPDGKFEKEFGITNPSGVQLKRSSTIDGIVNNNTFFSNLDNMGDMLCFDFSGKYIKTLKLNYMARQVIALPNNKLAVVGWAIWETKFRDFVSIVDYATNKEKVIWEHFTDRCRDEEGCKLFSYSYQFKERGAFSVSTMPFSKVTGINGPPQIECVSGKLVVSIPATGEILCYDLEGNLKSKDKIGWATNFISVEEQKEIQAKAIERFKSIKEPNFASWVSAEENKTALDYFVGQMEADLTKIIEPIPIPVFSTIIKDSDGNLLYFEYPKQNNANKFNVWVYENNGEFVCQSSFVCDEYDLQINPSKMVFHDGYIYGLQLLKGATNVPLRLVRFKVSN